METRTWRRWALVLSGALALVAVFAILEANVNYPRPEEVMALGALGLGIGIVSAGFALTTDPNPAPLRRT